MVTSWRSGSLCRPSPSWVCVIAGVAASLAGCTDPAPACTLVACGEPSTFTLRLEHELPLAEGPYQLRVDTGQFELRCSVGPDATGEASCFGWRFSDVSWDATEIVVVLIDPFYDTDQNPDGSPFEQVEVRVTRGTEELASVGVAVTPGEPVQPNGPDCAPSCWQATAQATLAD